MIAEKGIDSYKLKLTALVFMIVDHVYSHLNGPIHDYQLEALWPQWIQLLARFVSPLFLYLMVEGFYHTRSRKKYLGRLLTAGLIMMCGNLLINFIYLKISSPSEAITVGSLINGHDIFLTLADLFILIWCLENIKQKKHRLLNVFGVVITALLSVILEGGVYMLPVAFIVWLFHGKKSPQCIGICVWSLILLAHTLISYFTGATGTTLYSHMCFDNEWAMFPVIFFILLYNGERGRNTSFSKYMFYVIYPLHLWILMIIRYVIK